MRPRKTGFWTIATEDSENKHFTRTLTARPLHCAGIHWMTAERGRSRTIGTVRCAHTALTAEKNLVNYMVIRASRGERRMWDLHRWASTPNGGRQPAPPLWPTPWQPPAVRLHACTARETRTLDDCVPRWSEQLRLQACSVDQTSNCVEGKGNGSFIARSSSHARF